MPAYDKWFDAFAEQWATKNGIKVTIDHVPHLQIPAKIAAEIATQSGHDIVQLVGSGTEKWAGALMDVQDVADKLAKKHGGWTPLAENYCQVQGRREVPRHPRLLHRLPRPLPQGSVDRDRHAQRPRFLGRPAQGWHEAEGQGLPGRDRARAPRRLPRLLAGDHVVHGASEVAKDGKTLTYNSKEMREALKFIKALYKEAMTPEVLAWDDASNNRFLASGRGSWIHNPISAYRTIEGSEQGARRQDLHAALAQGPGRRGGRSPTAAPTASPSSRKNGDGAKAFLEALVDVYREGAKASTGYNMPFLKNYAKRPLPIISEDPKLKALERTPSTTSPPATRGRSPWPPTRSTSSS